MPFDLVELKKFPSKPGVYLMKDIEGKVLYIGKAKNLRNRIRQYFIGSSDKRAMIDILLSQIDSIDTILVNTEREALILENNLIKTHKPKYNILLKDDKTYISLMITNEKWPQLKIVRKKFTKKAEKSKYFGPYTNTKKARETLDLLLQLFPLRQCSNANFRNRTRPCILFEIKRCLGPCCNKCTEKEYSELVTYISKVLKGKNKQVIEKLQKKIQYFSDNLNFEKAQSYLEIIEQVKLFGKRQHVENISLFNADALGFYFLSNTVVITKLMFREKRLIASEHFSFTFTVEDIESILESFILQHYTKNIFDAENILIPFKLKNSKNIEAILFAENKNKRMVKTKIICPQKGEKLALVQLANKNAKNICQKEQEDILSHEKLLINLQKCGSLINFPKTIECIDTSHLAEKDKVASLITYVNGKYQPKDLKLFHLKTKQKGDISAFEETLLRHYKKAKDKKKFPDLLIVDGGRAQINVALKIWELLDIATIDIIGLVKEDARHDKTLTREKIYLSNAKEPILLSRTSPLLFFLQKIRDTAHEKAIFFHRKTRGKKITKSVLDTIPNIGKVKKKALLKKFKSLSQIKKATKKELSEISSLTKKDVEVIFIFLKKR